MDSLKPDIMPHNMSEINNHAAKHVDNALGLFVYMYKMSRTIEILNFFLCSPLKKKKKRESSNIYIFFIKQKKRGGDEY